MRRAPSCVCGPEIGAAFTFGGESRFTSRNKKRRRSTFIEARPGYRRFPRRATLRPQRSRCAFLLSGCPRRPRTIPVVCFASSRSRSSAQCSSSCWPRDAVGPASSRRRSTGACPPRVDRRRVRTAAATRRAPAGPAETSARAGLLVDGARTASRTASACVRARVSAGVTTRRAARGRASAAAPSTKGACVA